MKKILYLHQYFNTNNNAGGTRSYEFAKALIDNGYYVYMVSGKTINRKNIKNLDNFEFFSTNTKYSNSMSYLRRFFTFLNYVIKSIIIGIKLKGIDIVFASSTPLTIAIPGYILSRYHRAKFIFEVRDVWPDIPIELGVIKNKLLIKILKKFELFIYNKANHIIVASRGMLNNLLNKGINNNKISVITNMANIELFNSIKIDKNKEKNMLRLSDNFICIHPGTMGFVNGLDYLLDVAKEIRKMDSEIVFLLIGDGKEGGHLINRKNTENINNVIFLKSIPKKSIIKMIKSSDLGIMSVRNFKILEDNSANKFFDFLAAGLPVLINYGGWQKKELELNKAGFACSPAETADMVEKILFLKRHKEIYNEMSKNSKALAKDKFSRSICCNKLINILKNL